MRVSPQPVDFAVQITEKVRYSDTDRQGHVNNLQFGAFLEAGRAEILHGDEDLAEAGCFFVLARTAIDYIGELHWPGAVVVASRIVRIGRTSATIAQALFQNDQCAAIAESVMVQVEIAGRSAAPLNELALAALGRLSRRSASD